jgi:hypothetical protein
MGETRNAYRILTGKSLGRHSLGKPIRRREDRIKICLSEMDCEDGK